MQPIFVCALDKVRGTTHLETGEGARALTLCGKDYWSAPFATQRSWFGTKEIDEVTCPECLANVQIETLSQHPTVLAALQIAFIAESNQRENNPDTRIQMITTDDELQAARLNKHEFYSRCLSLEVDKAMKAWLALHPEKCETDGVGLARQIANWRGTSWEDAIREAAATVGINVEASAPVK